MLFAYAYISTPEGSRSELCLIPRKPSRDQPAVPVHSLHTSDCAVFYVGGDENAGHETVVVQNLENEAGIEIKPMRPAVIYATPNNPERPGERVEGIKIKVTGEDQLEVFVKRGTSDEWVPWTPGQRFFALA